MNKVVRQGEPNFYGVYDMYGMVWEWTYDFNW
jgi:formylglycine-generating enzyme required for sulfatase activity